jgi:ubiquinone biosynthesis protein UbiJ
VSDPVSGALERFLNAQLERSTPARRELASLAGRTLGIVLVGPEIELVMTAGPERLHLARTTAAAADVSVAGTPLALLEALRAGKTGVVGRREITVTGDAHVLESFSELLAHLKPDIEEVIAGITGDILAHESVRAVSAFRDWGKRAVDALAMNSGEYLQEENRALPARHEVDAFCDDVETLRDDVERAAVRLDRLEASRLQPRRERGPATGHD